MPLRLAIAAVSLATYAQAAVIYSTFSDTPPGYAGDGASTPLNAATNTGLPGPFAFYNKQYRGIAFVLAQDAIAEGAALPLIMHSGQVRVSLMDSGSQNIPNAVLDSFLIDSGSATAFQIESGAFTKAPALSAGVVYWLVASIDGYNGYASWGHSYPFYSPLSVAWRAINNENTFWPSQWYISLSPYSLTAFRIEGQFASTAVPEPATFGLAGASLLLAALAIRKRDKLKGSKHDNNPNSSYHTRSPARSLARTPAPHAQNH